MHYFNSTAIHAASYDSATANLRVWFTSSGQGYDYPNVPQYIWDGLLGAASAGTYFNAHIREHYAA